VRVCVCDGDVDVSLRRGAFVVDDDIVAGDSVTDDKCGVSTGGFGDDVAQASRKEMCV